MKSGYFYCANQTKSILHSECPGLSFENDFGKMVVTVVQEEVFPRKLANNMFGESLCIGKDLNTLKKAITGHAETIKK